METSLFGWGGGGWGFNIRGFPESPFPTRIQYLENVINRSWIWNLFYKWGIIFDIFYKTCLTREINTIFKALIAISIKDKFWHFLTRFFFKNRITTYMSAKGRPSDVSRLYTLELLICNINTYKFSTQHDSVWPLPCYSWTNSTLFRPLFCCIVKYW